MPKYPFINFLDPKDKYFLTLSHSCKINYDFEKYSSTILATICQRFRHFNPFVCIPKYPFVNFWDPIHNYFFSLTDSSNINYKHTQKNYSIILGIICHRLRKLNQSEHMPKYPFINFLDPKDKYFLTLSHSCNINYDFEKYSSIILATICQIFRHFNPSVCIPKYPFINFWDPIHNYFFSLTNSSNINYKHEKKNYSIILGIICHSLRKFNQSEHMPKYPFLNFLDPKNKYFLTLSHSCNINYDFEKYSSIILATICQRFRHFNPLVCIPKYPFINFWDPIHNYFFSLTDSCNINYKHEKKLLKITHPWHLSHIYDTLTFKFKCQGWGGGGGVCDRNTPPPHHWHLSHIYDTLTFKFKCQGWGGGGGGYVIEIPPPPPPPSHPWHLSHICVRGGVVLGGL